MCPAAKTIGRRSTVPFASERDPLLPAFFASHRTFRAPVLSGTGPNHVQ